MRKVSWPASSANLQRAVKSKVDLKQLVRALLVGILFFVIELVAFRSGTFAYNMLYAVVVAVTTYFLNTGFRRKN